MSILTKPRYKTATPNLKEVFGNNDEIATILEYLLHETDLFAHSTASQEKGGPFGALTLLINPRRQSYVFVGGGADDVLDSNAVVSKGLASAHAEAENLSPERRKSVVDFLSLHKGKGWKVVQVSSGESCQSCRAKQVLFAQELERKGLIGKGDFHVVFKATYEQTRRDASFNDEPYDQTFRAIHSLEILERPEGIIGISDMLQDNPETSAQINDGSLIHTPVSLCQADDIPKNVKDIFDANKDMPVAILVKQDGTILSWDAQSQPIQGDLNHPEKTAIISALHKAAQNLRNGEDKFESWNLEKAILYTNIKEIGPAAYAESLWYNLSSMQIAEPYTTKNIDCQAQELPGLSNRELFKLVVVDYDDPNSPLSVTFAGDPEVSSVAHLFWGDFIEGRKEFPAADMARNALEGKQKIRLDAIGDLSAHFTDAAGVQATIGQVKAPPAILPTAEKGHHYNGTKAEGRDNKPV